jgi:hypothetical protein
LTFTDSVAPVTSAAASITAPSFITAGKGTCFFSKGSVICRKYFAPAAGVKVKRPRPSCSVRSAATVRPWASTRLPAMSAGFFAGVRAST